MSTLQNKVDFAAIITVKNANPNGDPLNGNRPRENYDGHGEISDVCIKRKLRNRFQDMGETIFVQSDDRAEDGLKSLSQRAQENIKEKLSREDYAKKACEIWFDVRTFGQVFAFKAGKKDGDKDNESVSVGVRGPVSVHQAVSVSPIEIRSMQITKSVNSEPGDKKSSDTMGMKHSIEFGAYVIYGSINVQLAEKTGFSEQDAEIVKEALRSLFENDSSSARPDGSTEVNKVFWWKHNNKTGQYSSAKVHRSLIVKQKNEGEKPNSFDCFTYEIMPLENLEVETLEGL